VSSTPGEGSRFELLLPLGPAGTTGVAEEDAGALPHRRLLVVAGEPAERAELDRLLRAWGQHPVLAATAAQALALLQAAAEAGGGFDAALLADPLPDGSATELARRLRALPIAHFPMLLMWTPPGARAPSTAPATLPPEFLAALERPLRRENLRRALRSCAAAAAPAHAPALSKPAHVLVVEDNVVNQEVAAQMLRGLGCRVRVACSAADGLKALCEARFDLVLMDIHMPGMDGAAALQRFRAGPSRRLPFVTPAATPVIAVTANALEGDAEAFLALGFDDYLSKPFRQSQLHTMLKRRLTPAAPATGADAGGAPAAAPDAATGDRWAVLLQVLDAPSLDRLRELDPKGTNGLIVRVLKAFEGSLQRLLAQLHDARRQGDHAAIRHVAHTLKSSSASVGALELSRLCADIERRIRQDETQDLDPLLDGMIGESGRVLAVLTPALGG
jgi:CheY-like chemotaxis protein